MSWLALIIVASAVPSETVLRYSLIQRRLLPHCDHVYSTLQRHLQEAFKNREYLPSRGPEYKQALDTRYSLGLLYKERSMFGKAVQQFELVVQGYKKLLGPEHSETVEALNQLEKCKVD